MSARLRAKCGISQQLLLRRHWNLALPDQVIETTAEHPFYVVNRDAWIPTQMLEVGDNLVTDDGQVVPVLGVQDAKRVETVYNFNIEEFHTYFVGGCDRGFSVWAHNAELFHYTNDKGYKGISAGSGEGQITLKASQPVRAGNPKGVYLTPVPPDQLGSVGLSKLGLTNDKVQNYFKLQVPDELVNSLPGGRGLRVKYVSDDLTLPRSAILASGRTNY
jgi:hypothetical protein